MPAAWGADFNPMYPSADRQQLLLFDGAGASATIDAGSHAFAWRLPGVIAGALTAALLYLLGRILFRRRLIAGLVGLFVIADGMFFVQSRIGMNDVYVGLFIVAAYTLFAAVWTGWWRGRAAFWVAMPVIGVLLGLALASKWVAAYAIGALLLLILIRSALGRVLAILGLIGITAVLGYMAISVPAAAGSTDPGFGNLTFLLIMVALTLLAVVVAVVHPIAWTDEEMRFGVGAPGRPRRPRLLRRAGRRQARQPRSSSGPSRSPRCWSRSRSPSARWSSSRCSGSAVAGGSVRSPRHRPPTTRSACSIRPATRPKAGCDPAGCSASRSPGWPPAWSCCRSSCTSSRTSRGPSSRTRRRRSSRAGRRGTPARRCST